MENVGRLVRVTGDCEGKLGRLLGSEDDGQDVDGEDEGNPKK